MVPMLLALYGHPDSGGIWENHLNSRVVKQGWKQILPDIWHSFFHHQELNCLLVVYVDDFKMAGPTANMEKAWASIKAAVNIGDPEPYDRYFGCMHREFQNIRCLRRHTHSHSPLKPRSQQPHNTEHKTGGSMMKQTWHGIDIMFNPEKYCTSRVMRGEVVLASPTGTIRGAMMFIQMIGKHLAIKKMNSGQEKQFSVMDKMDQTNSSTLQWPTPTPSVILSG